MNFLNKIPPIVQGSLLIIAGIIILFDAFGFATQVLRTLVLCGAIGLIIWGIYKAGLVSKITRLLKRDKSPKSHE